MPYGSSFAEYSHHQNQLTHWLLLSDTPGERPFMEKLKESKTVDEGVPSNDPNPEKNLIENTDQVISKKKIKMTLF